MHQFVPGSFKDTEGRVLYANGRVFRTLSPSALDRMQRLGDEGHLQALVDDHCLLPCWLTSASEAGLSAAQLGTTVMEHLPIPVVTYPYEWSFDMLRQAALLTLDLMGECLDRNLILKDATPYNFVPFEGRMVFIDTLSLDFYTEGQPWEGYGQFCREFLFPLLLNAYRHVDFQPLFRASLIGIDSVTMTRLLRPRDYLRKGVAKHVWLQALFDRSFGKENVAVRSAFQKSGFSKNMIRANLKNLRSLVSSLTYDAGDSEWIAYNHRHTYSDEDRRKKHAFVQDAVRKLEIRRLVDIGCNIGDYSVSAASLADQVIGLDVDPACINVLNRVIAESKLRNIVPIVANLLNPSPSLGWELKERKSLFERIRSDGFLALALVHHICIRGNVPLSAFVSMLRRIGDAGVVEWVDKTDAMVQHMLLNRKDVFSDYTWSHFETALDAYFVVEDVCETHGGTRKLCRIAARSAATDQLA